MQPVLKSKLRCVLLIDDDPHANFFNERALKKADCTEEIKIFQDPVKALKYFQDKHPVAFIPPDIIFLDINMPGMNGWEFLEAYEKLDKSVQTGVLIVMLTTSLNPQDREKAQELAIVQDFKNKPLTVDGTMEIIQKYFPQNLQG